MSCPQTPGNYEFVGEETALATAEMFSCEVHIYSALPKPLVYKPYSKAIVNTPLKMAFYEPAYYMALMLAHKNSKSPSSNQ